MGANERLVVELPTDLVAGLRQAMQCAGFASESELVEFLLRTWCGESGADEPDLETLRAFVAEGMADAEAGRLVPAEDVYARVRQQIEAVATNKGR